MKTGLEKFVEWAEKENGVFDKPGQGVLPDLALGYRHALKKARALLAEEQSQNPTEDEFEKWLESALNFKDGGYGYYEKVISKYRSLRKPAPVGLVERLREWLRKPWKYDGISYKGSPFLREEGFTTAQAEVEQILSRYTPESKEDGK